MSVGELEETALESLEETRRESTEQVGLESLETPRESLEQAAPESLEETPQQSLEQAAQESLDETPPRGEAAPPATLDEESLGRLASTIEALLFLSTDPLSAAELADATEAGDGDVAAALGIVGTRLEPGERGLRLRELGGGFTIASAPEAEDAARRLFSRRRLATLTPAQSETLAIVAYMQPISRPEISRIRGVSADSATATLLERGLIEEAGRSQFGAALYRTTVSFLKLFGLKALDDLPDVTDWDPSPEEQAELRDRLLRAGEARAGGGPGAEG